jgi:hypothetical protein
MKKIKLKYTRKQLGCIFTILIDKTTAMVADKTSYGTALYAQNQLILCELYSLQRKVYKLMFSIAASPENLPGSGSITLTMLYPESMAFFISFGSDTFPDAVDLALVNEIIHKIHKELLI